MFTQSPICFGSAVALTQNVPEAEKFLILLSQAQHCFIFRIRRPGVLTSRQNHPDSILIPVKTKNGPLEAQCKFFVLLKGKDNNVFTDINYPPRSRNETQKKLISKLRFAFSQYTPQPSSSVFPLDTPSAAPDQIFPIASGSVPPDPHVSRSNLILHLELRTSLANLDLYRISDPESVMGSQDSDSLRPSSDEGLTWGSTASSASCSSLQDAFVILP
ncbi:hypothetical protein C8R45DRAFT_1084348 [Mycena sanguinolenta]|nr:hypothetical protein C8R45DRAFT_1084348 [Mycena sanguinolenta]